MYFVVYALFVFCFFTCILLPKEQIFEKWYAYLAILTVLVICLTTISFNKCMLRSYKYSIYWLMFV